MVRATHWIAEALVPLTGRPTEAEVHRLLLAIRSAVGIQALLWLHDVAGLTSNKPPNRALVSPGPAQGSHQPAAPDHDQLTGFNS